jgi:hypothetical protein
MPWNNDGRNQRANATANLVTAVSMHNGDPGANGANEWSGGSYSRKSPSWSQGGAGVREASVDFEGPANEAATHVGFWNGGTFLGGFARTSGDTNANANGEYTANLAITSNA